MPNLIKNLNLLFSVVKAEWFNDCQSRCDSFYGLKCEGGISWFLFSVLTAGK